MTQSTSFSLNTAKAMITFYITLRHKAKYFFLKVKVRFAFKKKKEKGEETILKLYIAVAGFPITSTIQ